MHGISVSTASHLYKIEETGAATLVYLYVAAPVSSILYKCEAVETDIPCNFDNGQIRMNKMMRIKREHIFKKGQLGLEILKRHGVCWVRGPRRVPFSLSREIEDICGKNEP